MFRIFIACVLVHFYFIIFNIKFKFFGLILVKLEWIVVCYITIFIISDLKLSKQFRGLLRLYLSKKTQNKSVIRVDSRLDLFYRDWNKRVLQCTFEKDLTVKPALVWLPHVSSTQTLKQCRKLLLFDTSTDKLIIPALKWVL